MISARWTWVLLGAAVLATGAHAFAADPPPAADAPAAQDPASASGANQELFQRLFGTRHKEVMAAPTRDGVAKLVKDLLAAARVVEANPEMVGLLCDRAYEVAGKDPASYPAAIQSMELLTSVAPDRRVDASGRIIEIRKKQFYIARGKERATVGEQVIEEIMALADEDLRDSRTERVIKLLQDALQIANLIHSDQHESIRASIERAIARQRALKLVEQYKEQLRANPKDPAVAEKMVLAYVVDVDDPGEARKYTFLLNDGSIKTNLTRIGQGLEAMSIGDLLVAGDWYSELAGAAILTNKIPMLTRSQSYFEAAVERGAEGLELSKAKLSLGALEQSISKLNARAQPAPLARNTVLGVWFFRNKDAPLIDSRRKPVNMQGTWNWAADDAFERPTETVEFIRGSAVWPNEDAFMLRTGSMIAWVKPSGRGSLNGFVVKGKPGYSGHSDYGLQIDWSGNVVCYMGWPAHQDALSTKLAPLPQNEWSFVAYSWDEKRVAIWINGKPSGIFHQRTPLKLTDGGLEVGRDTPGDTEYFRGRIAAFNLYNVFLEDKQVKDLMNHQAKFMKLKLPKPDAAPVPPHS